MITGTNHVKKTPGHLVRGSLKGLLVLMGCGLYLILTTGCTMVGPDYVKPDAPVAGRWMEDQSPQIQTTETQARNAWDGFLK